MRTLHDSRPESARRGFLSGGSAVTLGGVGGCSDVPQLLRSSREWRGPKVECLTKVVAIGSMAAQCDLEIEVHHG